MSGKVEGIGMSKVDRKPDSHDRFLCYKCSSRHELPLDSSCGSYEIPSQRSHAECFSMTYL